MSVTHSCITGLAPGPSWQLIMAEDRIQNLGVIIAIVQEKNMFTHIAYNNEILSGKPHIVGTRLSIEFILELFASGAQKLM